MSNPFCESSLDFYDKDRGYDEKMDDLHSKALVYDYMWDNPAPVEGGGAVLRGLMRDAGATVLGLDLTATEKDDLFSTMAGGDPTDLLGEDGEVHIRKISWAADGDEPTVQQNGFVLIPVPGEEYRPVPAEDLNALHSEALRMDKREYLPRLGLDGPIPEYPFRPLPIIADTYSRRALGEMDPEARAELLENVVKLYRVELEELLAKSAPKTPVGRPRIHYGHALTFFEPKPDLRPTREDEVDLRSVRMIGRRGMVHLMDWKGTAEKTLCGLSGRDMVVVDVSVSCQRCLHSGELRGWKAVPTWKKRVASFLGRFR